MLNPAQMNTKISDLTSSKQRRIIGVCYDRKKQSVDIPEYQ